MLEPVKGLEFFEDIHRYRLFDDWLLHSVTGVLSHDMDPAVKARIEATRCGPDGWQERGTTIHAALEQHLLDGAQAGSGPYQAWTDSLLDNWLIKESKPLAVEYRLCEPELSLGGSFDFLIERDGQKILGDLKTVSSARAAKSRTAATAQLGGYLRMLSVHHPKLWIDRCVTLVSGPGVTRVLSASPDECWSAWDDAWGKYAVHLEIKEPF